MKNVRWLGFAVLAVLLFSLQGDSQSKPSVLKRVVTPLNVATAAAVFTQNYSVTSSVALWNTRRVIAICPGIVADCPLPRRQLLGAPWQKMGEGLAYATAATSILLVGTLADRLHYSSNRTARRLWWLPQLAAIGASVGTAQYNFRHKMAPPVATFTIRF